MVHLDDIDDRRLAAPATLSFMAGNSLRPSWACYVWGIKRQFRAHVEDRRTNQTSWFRTRDICRYSRQATTGFAAAAVGCDSRSSSRYPLKLLPEWAHEYVRVVWKLRHAQRPHESKTQSSLGR